MLPHAARPISGRSSPAGAAGRASRWENSLTCVRYSVLLAPSIAASRLAGAFVLGEVARWSNDETVIIDESPRIDCGYCAVALPYQGRYNTPGPRFVFGDCLAEAGAACFDARRQTVAIECAPVPTASKPEPPGFAPGVDADATPARDIACIAGSLLAGDIEDPDAEVTHLIVAIQHFRVCEQLGTGPGRYCLWE